MRTHARSLGAGVAVTAPLAELAPDARAEVATDLAAGSRRVVAAGALSATLSGGAVRWIRVGDVEVVRAIDYPIRDADWGTMPTGTLSETLERFASGPLPAAGAEIAAAAGFRYRRAFEVAGGAMSGTFSLVGSAEPPSLEATLELTAHAAMTVNRAGFVLLHPLAGVAGTPHQAVRPDGTTAAGTFPALVAPGQPMRDLAGLRHEVSGVSVDIAFSGEVFEMEDQRNWTDASFKTYCRPLSLPRPYKLAPGERIVQRIAITLAPAGGEGTVPEDAAEGIAPEVTLALEPRMSPLSGAAVAAVKRIAFAGVQVRFFAQHAAEALAGIEWLGLPVDLEIVVPGDRAAEALAEVAAACAEAGIEPRRVIALPTGYLDSIQPEGPWPAGATPADAADAVRTHFPGARIAGGVLTNFTEFNRCPPRFDSHDVTFGTSAIVHAADDASVVETLEALPAVFASAAAIAGERPLRLGLCTIAMRSNPYGSALADNSARRHVTMAMDDPRHETSFAAAFAVGVAAAAARANVASFSPAMACGPLGLVREDGKVNPLFHVVRVLGRLAGQTVRVEGAAPGLVRMSAGSSGLAANFSADSVVLENAALLPDGPSDAGWAEAAGARIELPSMRVAVLSAEAAR